MNIFRLITCLLAGFFITIPAPDPVIAPPNYQEVLTCFGDCPEEENPDCTDPFRLQLTENDAVDDGIFTAVTSRNGVYYVGGRLNSLPYLAAMRASGEIIWQRSIATLGEQHTVRHLDFDDEGMLLGVSSLGPSYSPSPSIFKLDPATGNAAWVRQFIQDEPVGLSKLLVAPAGGNYRLIGRSDRFGLRNGMITNINRATGLPTTGSAVYSGATTGGFTDGVIDPNTGVDYALSNNVQASSPQLRVTAIAPTNDIIWDKTFGLTQDHRPVFELGWRQTRRYRRALGPIRQGKRSDAQPQRCARKCC